MKINFTLIFVIIIFGINIIEGQINSYDSDIPQEITIHIKSKKLINFHTLDSAFNFENDFENGIKWKKEKAFSYYIEKDGKTSNGVNYKIHYIGFLKDGKQFDNSFIREEYLEFNIDDNFLLKSFSNAIKKFKSEGIGLIRINPKFGYGNKQAGNIPPNSVLYYLIYIVGIK